MPSICPSCGSDVEADRGSCPNCNLNADNQALPGTAEPDPATSDATAPGDAQEGPAPDSLAMVPSSDSYFAFRAHNRDTRGPLTRADVLQLIGRGELGPADSVRLASSQQWTPLLRSEFETEVAAESTRAKLAASTCPRCGAGMAVTIKRSGFGLFLVILGMALTPVFGCGIPIFIVGYIMRFSGQGTAIYICPQCNYKSG